MNRQILIPRRGRGDGDGKVRGWRRTGSFLLCLCLLAFSREHVGAQTDTPAGPHLLVRELSAHETTGGIAVEWRTEYELDVIGFHLYRHDAGKTTHTRITDRLLPGLLTEPAGGGYRFVDTTAFPGRRFGYTLAVVSGRGGELRFGPVAATAAPPQPTRVPTGLPVDVATYLRSPHPVSLTTAVRRAIAADEHSTAQSRREKRVGDKLKIAASQTGVYRLDADVIAANTGMSTDAVSERIAARGWRMTTGGNRVAWVADHTGIYFFNRQPDGLYADHNVFWLEPGNGIVVPPLEGVTPSSQQSEPQTFVDTVVFERDRYAAPGLFSDPESDYWLWAYVYAGSADTNFPFRLSGVAVGTNVASITVRLLGVSDSGIAGEHHAVFTLNDIQLGEATWQGLTGAVCTMHFDQSILSNGANELRMAGVLETNVPYSVFYADSFDLTYRRTYVAEENCILFHGGTNRVVTVAGFTSESIHVLDITDETMPRAVRAAVVTGSNATFAVTFEPSAVGRFAAFTPQGALLPTSVWADVPSSLRSSRNRANYVVITSEHFRDHAEPLRAYRQTNGWETALVVLEDIYDEFSRGIPTPHAIRRFLRHAYTFWQLPPSHVVLAGEGTYDYRNLVGTGECVVPVLMWDTPYRLFAADNLFGDVTGEDGVPEIAIGRLPAATTAELDALVDKTLTYEVEAGGVWTQTVVMAADNPDGGGNYPADSDTAAALLPADLTVRKVYLSDHTTAEARVLMRDSLQKGTALLHFVGNCGWDRLAAEGLLTRGDVGTLTNATRLAATVGITCFLNRFEVPGHDFLGEELLLRPGGGAVCVWGATGLSVSSLGQTLDHAFLRARYGSGRAVIGDAVRIALEEYGASGQPRFMLDIYALLGDPALRLK